MRALFAGALLLAAPLGLPAQNPEYQLRFLSHAQWTPSGRSVGIAAWAVLPNVMHDADPQRTLLLGGALIRNRRRWVEVMAGALVRADGSPTVLDVRYLERLPWMSVFVEGEYNVGDRKLSVMTNATVPAGFAGVRLRAGLEGEWIHTSVADVQILGPRLTMALPFCGRLCSDVSVTTAFRLHSDGHRVLRQYVGLTF